MFNQYNYLFFHQLILAFVMLNVYVNPGDVTQQCFHYLAQITNVSYYLS